MTNKRFFNTTTIMFLLFIAVFSGAGCGGGGGGSSSNDDSFTVLFDSNGGTEVPNQTVVSGGTVPIPDTPVKDGNIFAGWYTDNDFEHMFLFGDNGDKVTQNITLYAQWIENTPDLFAVEYALSELSVVYKNGNTSQHVTDDVTLQTSIDGIDGVRIEWNSNNSAISSTGTVTRPNGNNDVTVALTATVSKGEVSQNRIFNLNVVHQPSREIESIPNRSILDLQDMASSDERELNITYNDEETRIVNIDGRYSDIIIKNADDALDSLQSIHTILGLTSAHDELFTTIVESNDHGSQYTFNQYYGDYPVYARSITAAAQADGTSNYVVSGIFPTVTLDTVGSFTPSITQENAEGNALANYESAGDLTVATEDTQLVIYTLDEYETSPTPVYIVRVEGFDGEDAFHDENVFVNANDGSIIKTITNIHEELRGRGNDERGNPQDFDVTFGIKGSVLPGLTPTFFMRTGNPNIQVYNQVLYSDYSIIEDPVDSVLNLWTDGQQISAYVNMQTILNWWAGAPFYRNSLKNDGSKVRVITHDNVMHDNAYWNGKGIYICDIGNSTSYKYSRAVALDTLTHESTHAVMEYMVPNLAKNYFKAPGAINEGYADVFGCLRDHDWEHGRTDGFTYFQPNTYPYLRNVKVPGDTSAKSEGPSFFTSYDDIYGANADSSDGYGVHYYSFLVSHAAYLMWEYAGKDWDTLASLWYESLKTGTLNRTTVGTNNSSANFHTVREALLRAAIYNLQLSNTWRDAIRKAFDAERIYAPQGYIRGTVSDIDGNPISGASVVAYHNGEIIDTKRTDTDGTYAMSLDVEFEVHTYNIQVIANTYKVFNATQRISTTRETVLDVTLVKEGIGNINGTITNATSGLILEGVNISIRSDWNMRTGSIIKTTSTDISGLYSMELEAGYYTMELSKEEYSTTFLNIVVAGNTTRYQNGSISPIMSATQYRAVLTWGENPRDLDSHMVCVLPNGNQIYHVFYSNKNGYDSDRNLIANLDVDDTSSYGPETLTFDVDIENTYVYYVHWYAGNGTWSGSQARVELYRGEELVSRYTIPNNNSYGYKQCWNVFKIANGIITSNNTITDTAVINSASSGGYRVSDTVYGTFRDYYPAK